MELIKQTRSQRLKVFFNKITDDNLFLLSSSISYYSALALAPFLLILLWLASFIGQNIQAQIVDHAANNFSPEVAETMRMVFSNINEGVSIGSISGIVGLVVLLFTCSLVFLQFRYALDVIYDYHDPEVRKSWAQFLKEKIFAMVAVLLGIVLLMVSFAVTTGMEYIFGRGTDQLRLYHLFVLGLNFLIYQVIFTGLHKFGPSRRQKFKNAAKIAAFSSVFFILGNIVLASYFKHVARGSVYGAAGALLVFLIWSYYSSFIIFLSVEVFQYLRKSGRIKA